MYFLYDAAKDASNQEKHGIGFGGARTLERPRACRNGSQETRITAAHGHRENWRGLLDSHHRLSGNSGTHNLREAFN